jgi:hypothetical protein
MVQENLACADNFLCLPGIRSNIQLQEEQEKHGDVSRKDTA